MQPQPIAATKAIHGEMSLPLFSDAYSIPTKINTYSPPLSAGTVPPNSVRTIDMVTSLFFIRMECGPKSSWKTCIGDQLKLRGGYGVLGNQEIDNYQYSSTITTGINYPDGNGGLLQGAFPKNFANPDIKWEETAMTNVGIDFMAFNNRLKQRLLCEKYKRYLADRSYSYLFRWCQWPYTQCGQDT